MYGYCFGFRPSRSSVPIGDGVPLLLALHARPGYCPPARPSLPPECVSSLTRSRPPLALRSIPAIGRPPGLVPMHTVMAAAKVHTNAGSCLQLPP